MMGLRELFQKNAEKKQKEYEFLYPTEFRGEFHSKKVIIDVETVAPVLCAISAGITGSAAIAKTNGDFFISAFTIASTAIITGYPFIKHLKKHKAFLRIHASDKGSQEPRKPLTLD